MKILFMKKLFVLLSVLCLTVSSHTWGQEKEDNLTLNKEGVYEEVVQLPGASQADIYKHAKTWIQENMKTDDNNIFFDDKEYTINNSAALKINPKNSFSWIIKEGATEFKFHVWSKDGRYKLRIDNVVAHIIINERSVISPKTFLYSELKDNKLGSYLKDDINEKMAAFIQAFKK